MSAVLSRLLSLAILPVELFAASLLYCQPLRHRKHYLLRIATAAAIILLLAFILRSDVNLGLHEGLLTGAWGGWDWSRFCVTLIYSFLSYLLAVALAFSLCAISLPEAIYCATCAYLTQHATYSLHCLLAPGAIEGETSTYTAWYFVIYGSVYWVANRLVARRIAMNGGYHTGLSRSLRLTASALAVALVLSSVGKLLCGENIWLFRLCLLYGVSCCFFVLWGQLSQQRQLALQEGDTFLLRVTIPQY